MKNGDENINRRKERKKESGLSAELIDCNGVGGGGRQGGGREGGYNLNHRKRSE